jgi:hypothetical protein
MRLAGESFYFFKPHPFKPLAFACPEFERYKRGRASPSRGSREKTEKLLWAKF